MNLEKRTQFLDVREVSATISNVEPNISCFPDHDSLSDNDENDTETENFELNSNFNFVFDNTNFIPSMPIAETENFGNLVVEDAEKFAAYCYGHSDITINRSLGLIDCLTKFQNGSAFFNSRNNLINRLRELGESPDNLADIEEKFETLQNPFENLNSDYLIKKHFQRSGNLIMPIQCKVGEREEYVNTSDGAAKKIVKVDATIEFVPLRSVLQKFFEIPGVLPRTLEYIQKLKSDDTIISNFIQGEFWHKKKVKSLVTKSCFLASCTMMITNVMMHSAVMPVSQNVGQFTCTFQCYRWKCSPKRKIFSYSVCLIH